MLYAPPMLLPISIALMVAAVPEKSPLPDALALKRLTARLAPVDLEVDISRLPQPERAALAKMLEAAQIMDPLFLRQSWSGNETLFFTLAQDKSPLGQERLHAFFQNKGPWDRIDLNRPFIPGVPEEKPPSGNFYPAGATKADVEKWMKSLPRRGGSRRPGSSPPSAPTRRASFTLSRTPGRTRATWAPLRPSWGRRRSPPTNPTCPCS